MALPNCRRSFVYRMACFERSLRQPDHLCADADATLVQCFDRDFIAPADLAQHVVCRNPAVFEQQLTGAARPDSKLVFLLADVQALELPLHDESRDAFVASFGTHGREHDEHVGFIGVRNPQLAAAQPVLVSVFDCAGREGEGVTPGTGFRQRVCAHGVCRESRQIATLEIIASEAHERIDHERVLDVHQHANGWIDPREHLDRQHGVKEARPGAPIGLGDFDTHDPEVEQLADELARHVGLLVHVADERTNVALGELLHAVPEQDLVVGQLG